MTPDDFEKLMKYWRRAQGEEWKAIFSPRTASCLSFDALRRYTQGENVAEHRQHVAACGHCQVMVRLFTKYLPEAEESKKTKPATLVETFVLWGEKLSASIQRVPDFIFDKRSILKPTLVGIALVLVVGLAFLFLRSEATTLAELASIAPAPYRPLQVKSSAETTEAERLFEEGMVFYVQKNYAKAVQKLALAVQKDSTNASFHFYLGLCYLLSDSVDLAIAHLQRAIALGGDSVLEKAYWYLGNAWLLKGERDAALQTFREIVELKEDYQWEAQEIIGKIEELSRQ